jgi:hypothetical protein
VNPGVWIALLSLVPIGGFVLAGAVLAGLVSGQTRRRISHDTTATRPALTTRPDRQTIDLAYLEHAYVEGRIDLEAYEAAVGRVLAGELVRHLPYAGSFAVERRAPRPRARTERVLG